MRRRFALAAAMALVLGLALGCARSAQYQRGQEFSDDGSTSYYDAKKPAIERAEQLGQPKKRVVILNFWNDTPVRDKEIGQFAADELRRGLHLTQRMIVPPDVRSEYQTQDLVSGDRVRVSQVIREGRRMGVAVVILGRISKIVFRQKGDDIGVLKQKQSLAAIEVELKLFDVQAGREIMAVGKSAEATSSSLVGFESQNLESAPFRAELAKLAARGVVAQLIPEVIKGIEKLTWAGRIAKVQGTRVYVNAGRASGLVSGDILKVLTPGDDVFDPATGAFLGRTQGQLKGTLEVVDFLGSDGAVCDIHTGGNFQEGDNVQLY